MHPVMLTGMTHESDAGRRRQLTIAVTQDRRLRLLLLLDRRLDRSDGGTGNLLSLLLGQVVPLTRARGR